MHNLVGCHVITTWWGVMLSQDNLSVTSLSVKSLRVVPKISFDGFVGFVILRGRFEAKQ